MNEPVLRYTIDDLIRLGGESRYENSIISPMFSIRKLRLVYNELSSSDDFEFNSFDQFKQNILASVSPDIELGKWQAIAARR